MVTALSNRSSVSGEGLEIKHSTVLVLSSLRVARMRLAFLNDEILNTYLQCS